ncbi:TonB-dependent receptor [candidate division KSB1 bacterium]|nr:TonB-dependent receptor [candidate division KSB1 bacterium]
MHKRICLIVLFTLFFSFSYAKEDLKKIDLEPYYGKKIPVALLEPVDVDFNEVTLENALASLFNNNDIMLNYSRERLPLDETITLKMENAYVLEVLLSVLKKMDATLYISKAGQLAIKSGHGASGGSSSRTNKISSRIEGKVIDAATGEPLPGANIIIKGTSIGAATDLEGKYVIARVPPGKYTLNVTFIGYYAVEIPLRVDPGKKIEQNIEMSYTTIQGKKVTVTAQAEGQLLAINQQLSSNTIKNVVAADRIQEIPDVNAAESVGRLPGISIIRSGGEGQKVAIRGLSPKYNTTLINGIRMQSTDEENRSVDLSMISSNMLSGIEVVKVLTPDMDADAVGGTINLRLNEAKEGFHTHFTAQGGYNAHKEIYDNYKFTGNVSNRFFTNRFGVSLFGHLERVDRSSDRLFATYLTNDQGNVEQGQSPIFNDRVNMRDVTSLRNRRGAGIIFDYRLGNYGKLMLSNFYSELDRAESSQGLFTSSSEGRLTFRHTSNDLTKSVLNNALQGEYNVFGVGIDFGFSNSTSSQDMPRGYEMVFIQQRSGLEKGFTGFIQKTPKEIVNAVTFSDSIAGGLNASINVRDVQETARSAYLDFDIPFGISKQINGKLKLGYKFRYNRRKNEENQLGGEFNAGVRGLGMSFSEFVGESIPDWDFKQGIDYGVEPSPRAFYFEDSNYDYGTFLDGGYTIPWAVSTYWLKRTVDIMEPYAWYKALESFRRDYDMNEQVNAFYLMSEINFGKHILFIPGVRYEHTRTHYETFGIGPELAHWVDHPQSVRELTSERNNEHWFPQFQLRIKPVDWFDIRLASTKSLIRPDYRSFSPFYFYQIKTNEINIGNPTIVPPVAQNYDVYASVYSNTIGLFTAGVFYKEIDNIVWDHIFSTKDSDEINNAVTLINHTLVTTWDNVENTSYVRGIELDWQTNFWYLPSFISHLVMNINYTRLSSETRYPDSFFAPVPGKPAFIKQRVDTTRTGRMLNQPNDILNLTLGYDLSGLSLRLSFLYQGNTLDFLAPRSEEDTFTEDYYRWDFTANQKLPWKGFELFLNASNIFNEPDKAYQSELGLLSGLEYYGATADLGIRWRY